jgi:hypothetical protein
MGSGPHGIFQNIPMNLAQKAFRRFQGTIVNHTKSHRFRSFCGCDRQGCNFDEESQAARDAKQGYEDCVD